MPTLLEQIQALVAAGQWIPSGHGGLRRDQRGLDDADLIYDIAEATVVELYDEHGQQPAVLLLQHDRSGTPIHVLWGFHSVTGDALVITAYYPGLDRWEPDLTTRRQR